MKRRMFGLAATGLLAVAGLRAATRPPLVVAELFTSQGCSSCPPADALLTELSDGTPNLLALAFHVTYWDRLGWRDPFSLEAATNRQKQYAALWRSDEVYTPQLVIAGRTGVVGSDRGAVSRALRDAAALSQPVQLRREAGQAVVAVPAGSGSAAVLLIGYDPRHQTAIGRGENSGRTLPESNVVRGMTQAGTLSGEAAQFRVAGPAGERWAALLQSPDGTIIGAAREG